MVEGKTSGISEIIKAAFDENEKLSMEEHVAIEMQIIVEAYCKVAAKRFIDSIPMIVQKMFDSIINII